MRTDAKEGLEKTNCYILFLQVHKLQIAHNYLSLKKTIKRRGRIIELR